jgi:hypothetical protein
MGVLLSIAILRMDEVWVGYQSGMSGGCCYEDFFYDSARYDIPGLSTGGFMFLGMDRSVAPLHGMESGFYSVWYLVTEGVVWDVGCVGGDRDRVINLHRLPYWCGPDLPGLPLHASWPGSPHHQGRIDPSIKMRVEAILIDVVLPADFFSCPRR